MIINSSGNEKSILAELGKRIRQNRIALNITQAELAQKCGISPSTENRIESGEDSKMSNYIRILSGLNMLGNLDILIPEVQPDFKALYEQRASRKRAKPTDKKPAPNWTWGEDK